MQKQSVIAQWVTYIAQYVYTPPPSPDGIRLQYIADYPVNNWCSVG